MPTFFAILKKSFLMISSSFSFGNVYISSIVVQHCPYKGLFSFENRNVTESQIWGLQHHYSVFFFFLTKYSGISNDVWAGPLSWYNSQFLFLYKCGRFWWIALRKLHITCGQHSFLTVLFCGKNSWCTTLLQSKKTVSKTFTFDRTWRTFFGFGSCGSFQWDDRALS